MAGRLAFGQPGAQAGGLLGSRSTGWLVMVGRTGGWLAGRPVGQLAGRVGGRLAAQPPSQLVGCVAGHKAAGPAGWLASWPAGWPGLLVGRPAGWLAGQPAGPDWRAGHLQAGPPGPPADCRRQDWHRLPGAQISDEAGQAAGIEVCPLYPPCVSCGRRSPQAVYAVPWFPWVRSGALCDAFPADSSRSQSSALIKHMCFSDFEHVFNRFVNPMRFVSNTFSIRINPSSIFWTSPTCVAG